MSESFRFAAGAARTTLAVVAAIVAVVVITQQSIKRFLFKKGDLATFFYFV